MKKYTKAFLALAAVAALATGCAGPAEPAGTSDGGEGPVEMTDVTLTLNWVPYGEHAPFYYGLSEGFFEEEGINLTIQPGNGSGNTVQQVAQGNTDFGWADTPPLARGIATGMPVKSVGVFLQTGPSSVQFFSDQDIESPEDLVGKTVGGTPGDAMYGTFPAWLELNGVDPADVTVVNVDASGKIAALIEGRVDAIQGFYHDQSPTIAGQTGNEMSHLSFADYGMNLLGTGLLASQDTIDNDPELVSAMMRALARSFTKAQTDPEAAVAAMIELAEQTPAEDVMLSQLDLTFGLLGDGVPGVNTEDQWADTLEFLSANTDFEGDVDVELYWTPELGADE